MAEVREVNPNLMFTTGLRHEVQPGEVTPGPGKTALHPELGLRVRAVRPVAQVAEVTLAADGTLKVDRVVCAVDCGTAINPDIVAMRDLDEEDPAEIEEVRRILHEHLKSLPDIQSELKEAN